MKFTKMHGTGNDFILMDKDEILSAGCDVSKLAKIICHRHFGIGADGFMYCMDSDLADIKMQYFNSDGTKAEMCGNGIRCFARYVYEKGRVDSPNFSIETDAGIYHVAIDGDCLVEVEMGLPLMDAYRVPALGGKSKEFFKEMIQTGLGQIEVSSVRMGVPHTVVFEEKDQQYCVEEWGEEIEKLSDVFPQGTNVNFARVLSEKELTVETWERGAGKTLSCGTGVCASAYLAYAFGFVGDRLLVKVPGGRLSITIRENTLFMKGQAISICDGDFHIEKCDII